MRISHSAVQKYLSCPKMYEHHYINKIRPNWTSSALLFGDALDKAINALLQKTEKDAYEAFEKAWTNGFINKSPIYIPTCPDLLYANKDYDANLLSEKDYADVKERVKEGTLQDIQLGYLIVKKKDKSWDSFTKEEKMYYNYTHWLCMRNKAHYIIDGYKKDDS